MRWMSASLTVPDHALALVWVHFGRCRETNFKLRGQLSSLRSDGGDDRYDRLVGDLMDRPSPNDPTMILGALAAALNVASPVRLIPDVH